MTETSVESLHIWDLFDLGRLDQHLNDGYVKMRSHPELPLVIYNYAEKTAYEREWDVITSGCRGLICHEDGTVVARPWAKFFNLGEHPEGAFDMDAPVEVTDKQDGSLGILVLGYGAPFLATRGSFESEQAQHATAVYRERYDGMWDPRPGLTYLFEIVYPENRIVLDYGEKDDLILLGATETATHRTLGPDDIPEWPGPRTQVFAYRTLREALEAEPRPNAEGVVVRFPESGAMLKLKQADYMELHRIVTGLNARVVWEHALAGDLMALLDALPDEFRAWAVDLARDLSTTAAEIAEQVDLAHDEILTRLPDGWTRKDYAIEAVKHPHKALLFLVLDGKSTREHIWKGLRPSGDLVPRYMGQDVA